MLGYLDKFIAFLAVFQLFLAIFLTEYSVLSLYARNNPVQRFST